jgi:hypothetical protein
MLTAGERSLAASAGVGMLSACCHLVRERQNGREEIREQRAASTWRGKCAEGESRGDFFAMLKHTPIFQMQAKTQNEN